VAIISTLNVKRSPVRVYIACNKRCDIEKCDHIVWTLECITVYLHILRIRSYTLVFYEIAVAILK